MVLKGKSGNVYQLEDKPFAKGGEGEVFEVIGNKDIVAKIYKNTSSNDSREKKVEEMVTRSIDSSLLKNVAWPKDLLYDGKQFVGFVMKKMELNEELNVIYEYGPTVKYPHMDWSIKLTIAKNLCVMLNGLHGAGHICGDLNPKNIYVNPHTGFISLIDADSFHITSGSLVFRCEVAKPEYLAPEIQNKMKSSGLKDASLPTFTQETDRFALAIHIFQLLMNGVHPFACAVIPSTNSVVHPYPNENIIKNDTPFFKNISGIKIPAYAPPIETLPLDLQKLFRKVFMDGHNSPYVRPSAYEWHKVLDELSKKLVECRQVSSHIYYKKLKKCPWCEADMKYQMALKGGNTRTPIIKQTPIIGNSSSMIYGVKKSAYKKRVSFRARTFVVAILVILILGVVWSKMYKNRVGDKDVTQSEWDTTSPVIDLKLKVSEDRKISASDEAYYGLYGKSVDISGNYVVVGAPSSALKGNSSSSVYVYKLDDETYERKISVSDGKYKDWFGFAVSVSGNYIVIGAPQDKVSGYKTGSVYVYKLDDETYERKITADDAAPEDYFGFSVAISENHIVIGSPYDDDNEKGKNSGSMYIYKLNDEKFVRKITASDAAYDDRFGNTVAIFNNYIAIGGYGDDDNGSFSGSVYVYMLNDQTYERKITASDGEKSQLFGHSASIFDNYLAVGTYGDSSGHGGSVYIYKLDDEMYEKKISPSDGKSNDKFGSSVTIFSNYLLVGAFYNNNNGFRNNGASYLYKLDDEAPAKKITAGDGVSEDFFGFSVAMSKNHMVVGAHYDDDKEENTGSVYIYKLGYEIEAMDDNNLSSVEIKRNGVPYPMPSDNIVTEPGDYEVVALDLSGNSSTATFRIS
ncbi:hypothetical protein RI065_10015 [Mycoplasmatota bacterium zrk1]